MTTYTAIIDSEIDTDSPVTESLMTRIRDNPIAISEGSAGAPKIQNAAIATDAVRSAQIQASAVGASEIADGSVGATELGTNSVIDAKIKISSGTSYAGTIADGANVYFTLHNKSFFPMIHTSSRFIYLRGHITDGTNGSAPRFGMYNDGGGSGDTYDVDYYYVATA